MEKIDIVDNLFWLLFWIVVGIVIVTNTYIKAKYKIANDDETEFNVEISTKTEENH